MDGMGMMLKSMGIDTDKIMADFTQLKEGVTKTLVNIDERLKAIEKQNGEILAACGRIEGRQEKAWTKVQEMEALARQSQPHTLPTMHTPQPSPQNGPQIVQP